MPAACLRANPTRCDSSSISRACRRAVLSGSEDGNIEARVAKPNYVLFSRDERGGAHGSGSCDEALDIACGVAVSDLRTRPERRWSRQRLQDRQRTAPGRAMPQKATTGPSTRGISIRRRRRQMGPLQPQLSKFGFEGGIVRRNCQHVRAHGACKLSRRFPAGRRWSCQSARLTSRMSTSRAELAVLEAVVEDVNAASSKPCDPMHRLQRAGRHRSAPQRRRRALRLREQSTAAHRRNCSAEPSGSNPGRLHGFSGHSRARGHRRESPAR